MSETAIARIYIREDDRWRGRRLYNEILTVARDMHLAGGTVLRGVGGFGASGAIHSEGSLRPTEDLPMVVEIADTRGHLGPFVHRVKAMLDEAGAGGLIVIEGALVIDARASQQRTQQRTRQPDAAVTTTVWRQEPSSLAGWD